MKIMQLLCLGAVLPAAFALSAAEEIVVPFRQISGEAGSVKALDIPWHNDFKKLGTDRPATPGTRYKFAHDNFYLYAAVIAEEPDMAKLKSAPGDGREDPRVWLKDSLDLNFIPLDDPEKYYQLLLSADGVHADNVGEDDNTGTESYATSPAWASNFKLIGRERGKDFWSLEFAIPLGAFRSGKTAGAPDLALIFGRNRYAGGAYEASVNAVIRKNNFVSPPAARRLVLERFDGASCRWQLDTPAIQCGKRDGKLYARIDTGVINRTDKRANFLLKATLRNRSGEEYTAKRGGSGVVNIIAKSSLEIALPVAGPYAVRLELFDGRRRILAESVGNVVLDYQPVRIVVRNPPYRNNIYAGQKVDRIEAEVMLEENLGKPLTVTLQGKNVDLKQEIPAAAKVNKVSFPADRLELGDYTLAAGGARVTIRKLPPHRGEVWFDRHGITYVDGKQFLPYGYFALPAEHRFPGMTVAHTYAYNFKSPEHLREFLDRYAKANLKVILPPYIEFKGSWTLEFFSKESRQKRNLSAEQKKVLQRMVAQVKDHPAFFAYYAADEPEGPNHDFNPEWQRELKEYLAEIDPYHPVIMLNYGLEGVRAFAKGGDILMPDCYPDYYMDGSTGRSRRISYDFPRVAGALGATGYLVPQAFDWARTSAAGSPGRAPTFDELRQQNMLAFLGDAKGILPYSLAYRGMAAYSLRQAPFVLGAEIEALWELLIQPTEGPDLLKSDRSTDELLAGVKRLGDRAALIAVSVSGKPFTATIRVPSWLTGRLAVSGEKRFVEVKNGTITDHFEPHHTHLYLTEGLRSDAIDLAAVREEIARLDRERRKPGNLLAAWELSFRQQQDYAKGVVPDGVPHITASSAIVQKPYSFCGVYWLQDGIIEKLPRGYAMHWTPRGDDRAPWLEIDFGKVVTVGRVVFYAIGGQGKGALTDARVLDENGKVLGELKNNTLHKSEVVFEPVQLRKLKIDAIRHDRSVEPRLLSELEVYAR